MKRLIRSVIFQPDGVLIQYAGAEDVRDSGLLLNHQLFVPFAGDYADSVDELVDAAQACLNQALVAFAAEPPAEIRPPADDDEPSPYDNPNERPHVRS